MSRNIDNVLITGASSGLGLEMAKTFLAQGANLVLNASNKHNLEKAAKRLGDGQDRIALVAGDISYRSTGQEMVQVAKTRFGSVDVLVNNAGIFAPKPFLEVDEATLDRFLEVNLKGTYFTSQAAVAQMLRQSGGSIINIGTVLVDHAIGGLPITAPMSSKGGIHAFTRQLAAEFGKNNIRVNTIAPGIIKTPLHAKNGIDDADSMAGLHLLNRVGDAGDIADAALYLARANFVTGQIINVDGGHTTGHYP